MIQLNFNTNCQLCDFGGPVLFDEGPRPFGRGAPGRARHWETARRRAGSKVGLGDDGPRFFQQYWVHGGRQRRPRRRAHRGSGGAGAQAVQRVGHYGAIQGFAHGGKRRVPFVALVPGHRAGHGHSVPGGTRGPRVRDGARARSRGASSLRQHPSSFYRCQPPLRP